MWLGWQPAWRIPTPCCASKAWPSWPACSQGALIFGKTSFFCFFPLFSSLFDSCHNNASCLKPNSIWAAQRQVARQLCVSSGSPPPAAQAGPGAAGLPALQGVLIGVPATCKPRIIVASEMLPYPAGDHSTVSLADDSSQGLVLLACLLFKACQLLNKLM